MLRSTAKTVIARGASLAGVDRVLSQWRWRVSNIPLIVSYHRVVDDFHEASKRSIDPMLTSTRTFERHMAWLQARYEIVSLDDLMSGQPAKGRPLAAVTFDDGYEDVYRNAWPVLRKKGIPATVFVVTDLVGTGKLQLHDELYLLTSEFLKLGYPLRCVLGRVEAAARLDPSTRQEILDIRTPFELVRKLLDVFCQRDLRRLMSRMDDVVQLDRRRLEEFHSLDWNMISEMDREGITIGSHTESHVLLTNESRATVRQELGASREILERRLGKPVRHFAYPDGRFDSDTVRLVAEAGYSSAFTTCFHRDIHHPTLTVPRVLLWERSCHDNRERFSAPVMGCLASGVFGGGACVMEHSA